MIELVVKTIKDVLKIFGAGAVVSIILIILATLLSLLVNGTDFESFINYSRAILFIVGALAMFISAGTFLSNRKLLNDNVDQFRNTIEVVTFEVSILIFGVSVIFFGIIVDYISYL